MHALSKALTILVAFFMLGSTQVAYAEDRSFEITDVVIHALIDKNGDMHVTEYDTYRFDGSFNGIIVGLPTRGSDGIENFTAYDATGGNVPLRTELTDNADRAEYRVYAASQDEMKRFRLEYTLKNVVQVYADTAELYWQFIDTANENELGKIQVTVELPDGIAREQIRAFGHGPVSGTWNIRDDAAVSYEVSPLPAYTMMEVRVLFPQAFVPGSTRIENVPKFEEILAEEANWSAADSDEDSEVASIPLEAILIVLIGNIALGRYLTRKRKHPFKADWQGKYYRELPSDLSPAVLGYFLNREALGAKDLMATLLDLVRRKHVAMTEIKDAESGKPSDYMFEHTPKRAKDGLLPHEEKLIHFLFNAVGKKKTLHTSDIREYAKHRPEKFLERWKEWETSVSDELDEAEYVFEHPRPIYRYVLLLFIVEVVYFLFFSPDGWSALLWFTLPLPFFVPADWGFTEQGEEEYTKWQAFKRFLKDYTKIASREPLTVHLWEQYLVYAIPLGVANKVSKIARDQLPGAVAPSEKDHTLDYTTLYLIERQFRDAKIAAEVATSPRSSSSWSDSGGFSSGGGGGGGGGSRGAF